MDDTDFAYKDATFQTGIDSSIELDDSVLRLPDVVNFVALRETCLSEAPFVNRANRKFWKKWMDSSQYITILCATLKTLANCISDSGSVNVQGLYELQGNLLVEQMSMCIAEMLVMERKRFSRAHDNLFIRLPELLCYMLINSLHSVNPRQSRVFNSVKFREVLLDWLGELVGGIRLTNCQSDRKWLFADTIETPITVANGEFLTTLIPKATSHQLVGVSKKHTMKSSASTPHMRTTLPALGDTSSSGAGLQFNTTSNTNLTALPANARTSGGNLTGLSGSTCHFSVGNSPLVNIYMNLGRSAAAPLYACAHPVKLLLTTLPDRPLTSMTPDCLIKAGGFREKKLPPEQFNAILKTSASNRKIILKQLDVQRKTHKKDMRRADESLRIQYALLENKPVDTKKHIMASANALDNMKFNTSVTSSVGSNDV
jgi:hypothetical protein